MALLCLWHERNHATPASYRARRRITPLSRSVWPSWAISRTAISPSSTSRRQASKGTSSQFLTDQQKKHSDNYQRRNQSTDDERNNPIPLLDRLRSSAFLRCSEP